MVTGLQIRQRLLRKRRELGIVGQASSGSTTTLVDLQRLRGDTLPADLFGADAWLRITSGLGAGSVAKIDQLSGATGTITFSPAAGGVVTTGDTYEVWRHGIHPDEPDAARDRALTMRCTMWRLRPLSVLTDVETWTGKTGVETLTVDTMAFPDELAAQSLLVTNNGQASGAATSESYYVSGQIATFRLSGRVSVRSGTASVRVRDVTNAALISLNGQTQFTGRGWQRFEVTFQAPASCQEIQAWLGGVEATAVTEWAGVGLLPMQASRFSLPGRVLSETEVGRIYAWRGPQLQPQRPDWVLLQADRHRSALLGELVFGQAPGAFAEVWYQELHHYAALQTDYLSAANRTAGDTATTDCPLDYIEAATVVELIENMTQDPVLNRIYLAAEKDLGFFDRKLGARPFTVGVQVPQRGVLTLGLR